MKGLIPQMCVHDLSRNQEPAAQSMSHPGTSTQEMHVNWFLNYMKKMSGSAEGRARAKVWGCEGEESHQQQGGGQQM